MAMLLSGTHIMILPVAFSLKSAVTGIKENTVSLSRALIKVHGFYFIISWIKATVY